MRRLWRCLIIFFVLSIASCVTANIYKDSSLAKIVERPDIWLAKIQSSGDKPIAGIGACTALYGQRHALVAILQKAKPSDIKQSRILVQSDDLNGTAVIIINASHIDPAFSDVSLTIKMKNGSCVGWNLSELVVN